MADYEPETVTVERPEPVRARRAGALAGVPEGVIAGAGFGAVFGGPIGALIGAGVGVVSRRFRQSLLDNAAREQDVINELGRNVANQVDAAKNPANPLGLDRVQLEQIETIEQQRQKLIQLSLDPDPAVRRQAKIGLVNLSTAPVLQQVEQRANELADQVRTRRIAVGDRYHSEINSALGVIDKENADYRAVINSMNDPKLGWRSQVTQDLYKKYMDSAPQVEGGIPFVNKFVGKPSGELYTIDEITQGATAKHQSVIDTYGGRVSALMKSAQADGYSTNIASDG